MEPGSLQYLLPFMHSVSNKETVSVPDIVMRIGIYVTLSNIKGFILMSHTFIKHQL